MLPLHERAAWPQLQSTLFALAGALQSTHVKLEVRPLYADTDDDAMRSVLVSFDFTRSFWTNAAQNALASQLTVLRVQSFALLHSIPTTEVDMHTDFEDAHSA